jgi:FAD:protein FMN transferase
MACRFEVTLPLCDRPGVPAAQSALDEVSRLEQQLTVFRDTSEISYINRNAASQPVPVETSLFELLLLCQELHRETAGAFDVTSGPLTRCWGFLKRDGRVPHAHELEDARRRAGSEKMRLDIESQSVSFTRDGLEINLGSIGKGYAIDRIADLMSSRVRSALLSAGASSIRAIGSGDRGHSGWVVGVRNPRNKDRRLAVLKLRDCAMSTSGSEEQFFEVDGKRFGHIIDPRSGFPAGEVACVTVIAGSAALSDALATAFFVGGLELAERYCANHPGIMAIMLESESDVPVILGHNDKCDVDVINV